MNKLCQQDRVPSRKIFVHARLCVYSPSKCRCHIVVSEFEYLQDSGCLSLMGRRKLKVAGWSRLTAQTFLRNQPSTQSTFIQAKTRPLFVCSVPSEGPAVLPILFFPSSPQMSFCTQAPSCSASAQGRLGRSQKRPKNLSTNSLSSIQTRNPKLVSLRSPFEVYLCRKARSELPIHY